MRTWAELGSAYLAIRTAERRPPVTREGLVSGHTRPHVPSLLCRDGSIGLHNPHIWHSLVTPFTTFSVDCDDRFIGKQFRKLRPMPSLDAFWIEGQFLKILSHSILTVRYLFAFLECSKLVWKPYQYEILWIFVLFYLFKWSVKFHDGMSQRGATSILFPS